MNRFICLLLVSSQLSISSSYAQETTSKDRKSNEESVQVIAHEYEREVQGLLKQFCFDCHSGETIEADLDMSLFESLDDIRGNIKPWIRISEMLDSRQMPPKESEQPAEDQRLSLQKWTRTLLQHEAQKNAGDPGPVVLRRLNNSEYNYTIRDLTGLQSLDPTKEFPIDGAAGEGFINTGDALSMSPNLIRKYLDAGKAVADHAVFTPTGLRWSESTTRRNEVNRLMEQIREFYRITNHASSEQSYEEQGNLNLRGYLEALAVERTDLTNNSVSIEQVAAKRNLNPIYLKKLWQLHQTADQQTSLLRYIGKRLQTVTTDNLAPLAQELDAWRNSLWSFNVVGHIGRKGVPSHWQAKVAPLTTIVELERTIPDELEQDIVIHLSAHTAGDGNNSDYVLWKNARLDKEGEPPIYLANIKEVAVRYEKLRKDLLGQTSVYLTAVAEASALPLPIDIPELANKHKLDPTALSRWLDLMSIRASTAVEIKGHALGQTKNVAGYNFVNGWGAGLPNLSANASDNEVKIPGDLRGHGIAVHPTPTMYMAILWQAPADMRVSLTAIVGDAHSNCGDGTEFWLRHLSGDETDELWHGVAGLRVTQELPAKEITVRKGEAIGLYIGPRTSHVCDLTKVELTLKELDGDKREWDLAKDCADNILDGNPHADSLGNPAIWHFTKGLVTDLNKPTETIKSIPLGTLLETWSKEQDNAARSLLATEIQKIATGTAPADPESAEGRLYKHLQEFITDIPPGNLQEGVTPDERFGVHPVSGDVAPLDFVSQAPSATAFRIPAILAKGRTLRVSGLVDPHHGKDASVQLTLNNDDNVYDRLLVTLPILSEPGNENHEKLLAALDEFRELFPRALAYVRLVPVDEVVTLVLWFREDQYLSKLMLTPKQQEELDALWDEFLFVAQEPLQFEVAYEQIYQFATQDRPDIVEALKPIEDDVKAYADTFRQRLLDTEGTHVNAIVEFAHQAWRRDLTADQRAQIHQLYTALRGAGLNHEPACRLTLARILTSPNFLFKQENAHEGAEATAVTSDEVASRLSYFLWSSQPDRDLRIAARQNELVTPDQLLQQTHRMLRNPRTGRMATEFAAQWLHVRDFDENDDKNEELYPEFAELREDMYRETLLFFDHLFRNNGSVLDILDADYTFLNETLAKHYGIEGVTGSHWRRVDHVKLAGRGGILGMSTTLAANSGASRTSPILRGNWIYETLLGERLPKPPADVPQLPELVPEGKTARKLIELHSSVAECAKCHALIDPYGFSLEQYDVLGRIRPNNIDTKTKLIDNTELEGLDGLRTYLITKRQDDFLHQFSKKLLGYSLGREIQLSDMPLIDTMVEQLKKNDYRINAAMAQIVTSKQFRYIRGRDFPAQD